MGYEYVSIQDFKRLEDKVNKLLSVHELDSVLTIEEKQLMEEVQEDIKTRRKEQFIKIDEL